MNRALKTETNLHNLRSGPILAVLINWARLCLIRPDFGRNADWLLEQCHKIWLAVGNAGSWKRLFLAWLFSWMIRRRRREGSNLLSFLLFYGLMVGKHCAMEIQKIHMVVHIFSGFALFTELMWVYRGVESLCKLLTANKGAYGKAGIRNRSRKRNRNRNLNWDRGKLGSTETSSRYPCGNNIQDGVLRYHCFKKFLAQWSWYQRYTQRISPCCSAADSSINSRHNIFTFSHELTFLSIRRFVAICKRKQTRFCKMVTFFQTQ